METSGELRTFYKSDHALEDTMAHKLLIIVPCGQSKIWQKHPELKDVKASEAYISAPFKVNKGFAEKFADKWIILSAKHGFIEPNFPIPCNYNVSFNEPQTDPISLDKLRKQARDKRLQFYDHIIALGGINYIEIVKEVFSDSSKVVAPTEGLQIGFAMKRIKSLTNLDKELMLKTLFEGQ